MIATKDARTVERFTVNRGTACSFALPVVADLGPVKIRDVSMTGVGLLLERRVEIGTLLAVGLVNQAKGFAQTLMVEVTHVTPTAGGFLVGGTFLTPLTYQEMTTLVL